MWLDLINPRAISKGPILFTTSVLLPATELVEVYFGYSMRAAFCAPDRVSQWIYRMLNKSHKQIRYTVYMYM